MKQSEIDLLSELLMLLRRLSTDARNPLLRMEIDCLIIKAEQEIALRAAS
jgi:hypothetical protein